MKAAALQLLACLALAGCGTTSTIQTVNKAVPVECKVDKPARPAMPTDALRPGAKLDDVTKAALAEIDLREGYEGELVTALDTCRKPLAPPK